MMLGQILKFTKPRASVTSALQVGARSVPLLMVHHPRARRYLLRLQPNGTVRVTIPRRGTMAFAQDFAARNIPWLEQQFQKLAARPQRPSVWCVGTEILFRGEPVRIEAEAEGLVHFGSAQLRVPDITADLRPFIQKHLYCLAKTELPTRVLELAAQHQISISRISVRNQKTRWGSCSRSGTISLNWRLIQAPAFVRDYIILHELAHRRQMNHSQKFWREVERLCPDYRIAERWVKANAKLLH